MNTYQDILQGKWPGIKGQVSQQWSKLTDDDLARMSGKIEELAGMLQLRYGYGRVQAEIEINHWLSDQAAADIKI